MPLTPNSPSAEHEHEPEHERGSASSPSHARDPLSEPTINPLTDTTADSLEPPRPVIADHPPDHTSASTSAGTSGQRRSWRIEHPYSSEFGLGVVDGKKDAKARDAARDEAARRTSVERHEQEGEVDHDHHDRTWNSNTLTLASSAAPTSSTTTTMTTGRVCKHKAPIYGHGQGAQMDWEDTWERQQRDKWQAKVRQDLEGWRGGHGTPRSNYSPTAATTNSYYGSPVTGTIGRDLPKEVLRIERDWSGGEVCQFETSFPMELERRITPTQFHDFVTTLNTHFISAYSTKAAVVDNMIAIATWWISLWFRPGHFETELRKIEQVIAQANKETFNPVGLNVLSPRKVALQFLEIEYY